MTAPASDAWESIRAIFPRECARYDEVLEFVRIHPGCGFSQLRADLASCDSAGLIRVLLQMERDGTVTSKGLTNLRIAGCPRASADMISTEQTATSGPTGSA